MLSYRHRKMAASDSESVFELVHGERDCWRARCAMLAAAPAFDGARCPPHVLHAQRFWRGAIVRYHERRRRASRAMATIRRFAYMLRVTQFAGDLCTVLILAHHARCSGAATIEPMEGG